VDLTSAPSVDVEAVARVLDETHLAGHVLAVHDLAVGDLGTAYDVQRALTARRLSRGDRTVGWKLGYTSAVMREQMGVAEPNLGPLLASMVLETGVLDAGVTQPRVEPEIALVLARDPGVGSGVDGVLAATASAHAALEVVDSVWRDYVFDLVHNTADGSSAAGVVLGGGLPLDGLADLEVDLELDGTVVGSGAGRDAGGHPAAGVAWLVDRLAERGEALRAGDVVITGGLTAAVALAPGSLARAVFRDRGDEVATAAVRRERG
jgi:2-keto-4-pentenoate hydratase